MGRTQRGGRLGGEGGGGRPPRTVPGLHAHSAQALIFAARWSHRYRGSWRELGCSVCTYLAPPRQWSASQVGDNQAISYSLLTAPTVSQTNTFNCEGCSPDATAPLLFRIL